VIPDGISGLELARTLRQHRPELPVLLAIGYSQYATQVVKKSWSNYIDRHDHLDKAQLASDRTSCHSPPAQSDAPDPAHRRLLADPDNCTTPFPRPMRSPLPTSPPSACACRSLATRVIETASRVRLAFAAACPEATLFRHIAAALMPAGP
jgi:hypothetical protein